MLFVLVGYLVDLVEEPVCECGIEIISYQLGEFGIDLVFSFRISNLRISKTFLLLLDTIIVMNSQKFPSTSYMLEYVAEIQENKRSKYNLPVRILFQGALAPALPTEKVSESGSMTEIYNERT